MILSNPSLTAAYVLCSIGSFLSPDDLHMLVEHSSHVVGVFIVARIFLSIYGWFQSIFYYLSPLSAYCIIENSFHDWLTHPNCRRRKYIVYIYTYFVLTLGIMTGIMEQMNRLFIPEQFIIDLMALGFSLRCKPDFLALFGEIFQFESENANYAPDTALNFGWIQNGITLFAGARNVGKIMHNNGLVISEERLISIFNCVEKMFSLPSAVFNFFVAANDTIVNV